jgi:uncharacterized SAM-binding protein YcdF (DUF218 family)
MFLTKKILGHLLMPLPLGLGLLSLGMLLWLLRRRARAAPVIVLGWLVLATASNQGVSILLLRSLEHRHPAIPAGSDPALWPENVRACAFVAVLGGGHGDDPGLSAIQRLSPSARARLTEALRLAAALPESWLVVSGPEESKALSTGETPAPTHARILADAATELGFPRERIVEIDTARDTAEETTALRRLAGDEPVALVTSAWHMRRAMRLADQAGLRAVPCPSDYLGRDGRVTGGDWVTWESEALVNTTRAWREYLGHAWTRLVAGWGKN